MRIILEIPETQEGLYIPGRVLEDCPRITTAIP